MQAINTPLQIGRILSARRKSRGLSQEDLSRTVHISQNRLSELEKNPDRLTVERLLLVLNALGLELVIRDPDTRAKTKDMEW